MTHFSVFADLESGETKSQFYLFPVIVMIESLVLMTRREELKAGTSNTWENSMSLSLYDAGFVT